MDSSQQNGTEIGLHHAQNETIDNLTAQNETIDNLTAQNETSLQSLILTNLNDKVLENSTSESQPNSISKDENSNGVEGETMNITSNADLTISDDKTTEPEKDVKTTEPENVLPTLITQENGEATQNDKTEDNGESNGDSSDSTNHIEDPVQDDPIDSNDSHVTERVDLGTLPDIRTEVDNSEETAAE